MGAVQALDPTRVAYLGSVSKVLSPALRIGWLIAPPVLRPAVIDAKHYNDLGGSPSPRPPSPTCSRTGVGDERHLRRTRALYRRRRDVLLAAVAERLPSWQAVGVAARTACGAAAAGRNR